ncbi:unnamed protein product, partial [Prorocentrum cordatum]
RRPARWSTWTRGDPGEREKWLYGYGFSYVYSRAAACESPYPDESLGEDLSFFVRLRQRVPTAVHFDEAGLCLHTLHARGTSRAAPWGMLLLNWASKLVFGSLIAVAAGTVASDALPGAGGAVALALAVPRRRPAGAAAAPLIVGASGRRQVRGFRARLSHFGRGSLSCASPRAFLQGC